MSLKTFTQAYIECALWSSTDYADESGGNPLDDNYGSGDIHRDTREKMDNDCRDFYLTWEQWWEGETGYNDERAGHDFWLTRNRHGAGFWDRGLRNGKKLTDAAHAFGSFDLYIGDDGKVHGQ